MNNIRMCSPFHLKSSNLNIADEWKSLLSPNSWQASHVSSMATKGRFNQAPTVTEQCFYRTTGSTADGGGVGSCH